MNPCTNRCTIPCSICCQRTQGFNSLSPITTVSKHISEKINSKFDCNPPLAPNRAPNCTPIRTQIPTCRRPLTRVFVYHFPFIYTRLAKCLYRLKLESRDLLYPRLIVCHPHVDAGQVRVGTLDAVGDGARQHPAAVVLLHHQRAAAVALKKCLIVKGKAR
jgi:hypothetical protein